MMRKSGQGLQSLLHFAADVFNRIQLANLFGPVRWIVSSQTAGDAANSIKDSLVANTYVVPGRGHVILVVSGK